MYFILFGFVLTLAIPTVILAVKEPDWTYISSAEDFDIINEDLSGSYWIRNKHFIYEDLPSIGDENHPFTGRAYFDGTLIEFGSIQKKAGNLYGLFAYNKGEISGLTLRCPKITIDSEIVEPNSKFGFLCGINEGTIKNCTFSIGAEISEFENDNSSCFGFVCAINKGSIYRCFCRKPGYLVNRGFKTVGGIVGRGENTSLIDECFVNTQFVFRENFRYVFGGIVGNSDGCLVKNCFASSVFYYSEKCVDSNWPVFGGIIGRCNAPSTCECSLSEFELHINYDNYFGAIIGEVVKTNVVQINKVISDTKSGYLENKFFSHSVAKYESENDIVSDLSFYNGDSPKKDVFFQSSKIYDAFKEVQWQSEIWSFDKETNTIVFEERHE